MKSENGNLNNAKRAKNDEFYTRLEGIEKELEHYGGEFFGRTVYLNCDDYRVSAFWTYFKTNFQLLGLKRLVATNHVRNITPEGGGFLAEAVETVDGLLEQRVSRLKGVGDFRSAESEALLEQADIVVSNPPFSLFREYVAQLVKYGKKFLIISSLNAVTYKEIWPIIQRGDLWLGGSAVKMFKLPEGVPHSDKHVVDECGQRFQSFGNIRWFTNLDYSKRLEEVPLRETYSPENYPKYDNYDAINVDKVRDIPSDYCGVMWVPITFLEKWNPKQFEIVGLDSDNPDEWAGHGPHLSGSVKYRRIFIRRADKAV